MKVLQCNIEISPTSIFPTRFISLGPRLSSFVLDTDDEMIDVSDALKILPLGSEHTIQLCGYPLHELDKSLLQQLPPNIVINEYGIEVKF